MTPPSISRRQALAGVALYAASGQLLTAAGPPRILTETEYTVTVEICDSIVPGARAVAVGRYLDYQLSLGVDSCLLFARYLPIEPPYLNFYRSGLAALRSAAERIGRTPQQELTAQQWRQLALQMVRKSVAGWDGPPSDVLYYALRNDALDVTYSTDEGLKRLGIPVMHHSHSAAPPFDRER